MLAVDCGKTCAGHTFSGNLPAEDRGARTLHQNVVWGNVLMQSSRRTHHVPPTGFEPVISALRGRFRGFPGCVAKGNLGSEQPKRETRWDAEGHPAKGV